MKTNLQFLLTLVLTIVFFYDVQTQSNTSALTLQENQESNFFEIQKDFNDYWDPKNVKNGYYFEEGLKKKAMGWKQFKRWEWYWECRIDPQTGEFPSVDKAKLYSQMNKPNGDRNATGNWQSLGPTTTTGGYAGLGRINCVGFRTGDNSTLYAGSPSGGLWKTTNGGTDWTVLTDGNSVLGVSDIVVIAGASTATDVVYIATGDRDGGSMWSLNGAQSNDNNTIGVLKSTNGGASWSTTALTYSTSAKKTTNRLLKHPTINSVIYAATTDGVYKTSNGGTTWPAIMTGIEFISMEFKPGDPSIMYGGTRAGKIYRSTNSGASWSSVLSVTGGLRVQLAVTADDATYVYAVVTRASGKLEGIYKSTNSGVSFTKVYDGSTAGQYILGLYCDGSVDGGQGAYDLSIVVDPSDESTVYVGGINTWKSTDACNSMSISNMWTSNTTYNSCGAPVVHADKHFMEFQNGSSTLFEGNDGGLYKTSDGGTSWTDISSGMIISQLYRLGVSQTSSSDVIAGLQDNGTKSMLSGTWYDVLGGDGMECAIDPTDVTTQYCELYFGEIYRTTNSWSSKTLIQPTTGGAWVTPFAIDPTTTSTLYMGFSDVWKSTNQGTAWTKISTWAGSTLRSIAVAPSNSNYIYTATRTTLYGTTNGGTSWTNITGTLPVTSAYITYIAVEDDDPLTVWVSFGEYNSLGVYQTTDGGSTWTNISNGLPSIPVMCVVQNTENTTDELYAGTDLGVYVKVGSANWALYSAGLPNVVVTELDIYYNSTTPNLSRLRAATYGRGLWETELYAPATSDPISEFTASVTTPIVSQQVDFTDLTNNDPTSWLWTFSPATVNYVDGTSATSQNPKVEFTATGSYNVSLYTANANGNDTETKTGYITVASSQTYCSGSSTNPFGYISRVQLGTIDKSSTWTDIGGGVFYEDWTSLSTNLIISSSNSITITNGSSPNSGLDLAIWIDWNRDGDFADSGEDILCGINNGGNGTHTINVPATASLGSTRMRLRTFYYATTCNSCGSITNGEVEDYTVNIVASSITWTGSTSPDWATAGNWSGSSVPTYANSVTIPSSPTGSVFPIIGSGTTDANVYDLTIQSGASISISGHLVVDGTLTNSAGNTGIIIESSSSETGSLLTNTDAVSATVKRYFTSGKWHLVGSPVSGATVNFLYFNGSPDVWLKTYVESTDSWSFVTSLNTAMPFGKGFSVWVEAGTNVASSFTGPTKAVDLTLTTSSTPPLAFTDASHGYNLLANPYPCPLDWDQGGWTRTNIDGSTYVWKEGSNYLTRNAFGQGSLTNGIIPVGQGFFVRATSSSPSLTIPKQARVQSSQAYHKPGGEMYEGPPYAVFDVMKDGENEEVWITFSEECTDDYDNGWDVLKRFGDGEAPQLYAFHNNYDLSIAGLPELGIDGMQIPLYFKARISGEHVLMMKDQKFLESVYVFLEDLMLGEIQDMHYNPTYKFSGVTSDNPNRFLLHFNPVVIGAGENAVQQSLLIYAWSKDIFIKFVDEKSVKNTQIQVFDLFGRKIVERRVNQSSMIKIPVKVSNTYLIVKVVSDGNVVIKKVFIK